MVRGLLRGFRLPVYIAFNQVMTKEILFNVIKACEEQGAEIVATVSDMVSELFLGTCVIKWQNNYLCVLLTGERQSDPLGEIGHESLCPLLSPPKQRQPPHLHTGRLSSFDKVITQPSLGMFATCVACTNTAQFIPQLFQDQGYILPNKRTTVTKAELVELHELVNKKSGADFRPLWKLSERHFQCANSERQRVFLATQVFSKSVAEGLKIFCKGKDDYIDFITLWNEVWDAILGIATVLTQVKDSPSRYISSLISCGTWLCGSV